MSLKSGHKIFPLTGREQEKQVRDFKAYAGGTIRLQPDGWFLTTPFIPFGDKYYEFKFKPNDVLVMTYPKCGTTWTQEIVWTLMFNPNLDHPAAAQPVGLRSPFIEGDFLLQATNSPQIEPGNKAYDMFVESYPERDPEDGVLLQYAEMLPDPRGLKTHLPFSLLSPTLLDTCKVIYVTRNPKDVAVSFYHHSKMFKFYGFVGTLDDFVDHFINDTMLYSPYWKHLKEAWDRRNHPNLHFCFYEDLKADPKGEIRRIQDFLGTKLTETQLEKVVEYTSFHAMKARDIAVVNAAKEDNPDEGKSFVNADVIKEGGGFFRKGIDGDWKNKLSLDHIQKIDEWTKKNVEAFGPDFKYGK